MSKNKNIHNSEYVKWSSEWQLLRDFIEGDKAVKEKGTLYLPKPCAHDTSEANRIRYVQYKERAYVIGFTGRTSQALLGQAFFKPPELQLSPSVEYLAEDANGDNLGLVQFGRGATSEVIDVSRAGILVDFPRVDGEVSAIDIKNGVRPYMKVYKAETIADWNTKKYGAINKLSSVKLLEKSQELDQFGFETGEMYDIERVLFLDEEGIYRQVVRTTINNKTSEEIITPTDGAGNVLDFIPFQFIGSESNTPDVDKPILLDIAILNRGQYRNSADDEEAAFKLGNPMLAILTDADDEELEMSDFSFGSNTAVRLNSGDDMKLVQGQPNTISIDRMNKKIESAQMIGARLITPSKQQTAEAARIDQGSEISVLSTINTNVTEAITRCVDWCELFLTGNISEDNYFIMSQEFFFSKMTSQERQIWIADVQAGNVPIEDYWAALRESRIIESNRTDEDLAAEIETQEPDIEFDEEPEEAEEQEPEE